MDINSRIEGALVGAVIGSELAFGRLVSNNLSPTSPQAGPLEIELAPDFRWKPAPHNQWWAKITGLVGLGVKAYSRAGGRAAPEDLASELIVDKTALTPAFCLDGLHTTQELLKEGMHPRLSGLHVAPCGAACAIMPAVGIFHFADPQRAYLDGVELASVVQPRIGADWAGASAAAVAAAFDSDLNMGQVAAQVMGILHDHNKDLFHENDALIWRGTWIADEKEFVHWYGKAVAVHPQTPQYKWLNPNPTRFALPALVRYHDQAVKLMSLIINSQSYGWPQAGGWMGIQSAAAMLAGAVAGAMHGVDVFPEAWRAWARPIAKPMLAMQGVVQDRMAQERQIAQSVQTLAASRRGGVSRLHDKIKGAILAGAIGNAMGSPVENKMYWEIDQMHPGGVKTVLEPQRLECEDDNQMAMLLVETYLDREGSPVMARDFGRTWKRKLNRAMFFPMCMGNSYDLICGGADPRITGHWNIVTGSTVMCMEPAGIFNLADPAWASQDAVAISYMYQRGLDVVAAGMLAATVAQALHADATVESICQAALDVAPKTPLRTFDKRKFKTAHHYIATCLEIADRYDDVLAARKELYDKCLFYHMIDPLELWGLALAMFKIARGDVRQAGIGGTNIGRDADTIAGRACMLAGALNGVAGVPREWIAMFSKASMQRIDRNSARLADLIATRKLPRMTHRLELSACQAANDRPRSRNRKR